MKFKEYLNKTNRALGILDASDIQEAYNFRPKSVQDIEDSGSFKNKEKIKKIYKELSELLLPNEAEKIVLTIDKNLGKIKILTKFKTNREKISKVLEKNKNSIKGLFAPAIYGKGSGGVKKDSISFSNNTNTKMGESLQIAALQLDKIIEKYNDSHYKKLIKALGNKDLANGKGVIENYLKDEAVFNNYKNSINNIIQASLNAKIGLIQTNGVIHKDIDTYYKITEDKGYGAYIEKNNTSDCVLYTGSNFLNNLKELEISFTEGSHIINLLDNNKVVNTFEQISLKNGGRLGDIPSMNKIANDYKKFYIDELLNKYEIFGEFISENILDEGLINLIKKAGVFIKKIAKNVLVSINAFNNNIKRVLNKKNNYNKYVYSLLANTSNINEAKDKIPYPTEAVIFGVYNPNTQKENYLRLIEEFNIEQTKVSNRIKEISRKNPDSVVYNLPEQKIKPRTSQEIRLFYFNIVSLKTLNDYLNGIKDIDSFHKLEIEAIYGNTSLPLIVLDTDKVQNPLLFLPIITKNTKVINVPVIGFNMSKVSNKEYFSFYIHILSLTKSDFDNKEFIYLNIQMRTKQDIQYTIDIQGTKTLKYIKHTYSQS